MRKSPQVSLVGAGPGDPDLISLAGVKALQSADVVLYDALVNPEMLAWAQNARKVFVGKRKGYKRFNQSQINAMLVSEARNSGHVVRLKGGDPFIFGRGGEEVDYVRSCGIKTVVIPGISSATSASVTQGIPLTKRGVSEGFWVLTGTTRNGHLSADIRLAARSNATLVILMGTGKLPEIVKIFEGLGKGNTPICVVQNAYLSKQKSISGTISSILESVASNKIVNPAVIIIGEVVKHGWYAIETLLDHNQYNLHQSIAI